MGRWFLKWESLGLILWIVMSVAILFSAWKVVKKLKGSPWFPVGFVILWYAFFLLGPATFGGMAAYEDFLLNAYFWLLLGMLFRLPTISPSGQFAIDTPSDPACAPLDSLTCGSLLFLRLSTGAMARSVRLRNCLSGSLASMVARFTCTQSASKTFR